MSKFNCLILLLNQNSILIHLKSDDNFKVNKLLFEVADNINCRLACSKNQHSTIAGGLGGGGGGGGATLVQSLSDK
jgi:hypothetical protein